MAGPDCQKINLAIKQKAAGAFFRYPVDGRDLRTRFLLPGQPQRHEDKRLVPRGFL